MGTNDPVSKGSEERPAKDQTPLMRALGQFFGEVWKGVQSDPRAATLGEPGNETSRRRVEEREVETDQGRVILRRTTIEEIIVPGSEAPGARGVGGANDVNNSANSADR